MQLSRSYAIVSVAALLALPLTVVANAPSARAACTDADGITVCDDSDGGAATSGLWYPYPCEDDFTCVDGASVFGDDSASSPPVRPDRPDIGLPGRPGDRPDRPDRPNRPSAGGES